MQLKYRNEIWEVSLSQIKIRSDVSFQDHGKIKTFIIFYYLKGSRFPQTLNKSELLKIQKVFIYDAKSQSPNNQRFRDVNYNITFRSCHFSVRKRFMVIDYCVYKSTMHCVISTQINIYWAPLSLSNLALACPVINKKHKHTIFLMLFSLGISSAQ